MKYAAFVCEGLSDEPLDALGNRTPLEAAKTPVMDRLAKSGRVGTASFTSHRLLPMPDVASFSILGYDPEEFYTGLAPLEAPAYGIVQTDQTIAFRCDLVTTLDDVLVDPSASLISDKEAKTLIGELNKKLGSDKLKIYPGDGHKNILLISDPELVDALDDVDCEPPGMLKEQVYTKHLPQGQGANVLTALMDKAREILVQHEINRVRIDLGENPANMIWLWGQGKRPKMPAFKERFGLDGAVVSQADFAEGLRKALAMDGLEELEPALHKKDFVFSYTGSPGADDTSHDLQAKIKKIEDFDAFLGKAVKMFERYPEHRILVTTDCALSSARRARFHGRVPFLLNGQGIAGEGADAFNEKAASQSKFFFEAGHRLADHWLKKK